MKKNALICLLLLCGISSAFAQKKLDFRAFDSYQYMMRVDRSQPRGEQLICSQNEQLPIWVPQNQIGWQLQDQNYFDLFFQHKAKETTLPFNFYKYIVLAIVEVDEREWSFQVHNVAFDPETNTVLISYRSRPFGPQLPRKQASTQILLIEQSRQIKNAGVRNLKFAISANEGAWVSEENSSLTLFPLAYTSEQYYSGNEMAQGGPNNSGSGNYSHIDLATQPEPGNPVSAPDLEAIEAEKRRQEDLTREKAEALAKQQRPEATLQSEQEAQLLAAATPDPLERPSGQTFFEPQGYMVQKTVRLEPVNYLLIENIYEWEVYLKAVPPGITPITPVSAEDFLKYYAVAIIKHEKRYWEMETTGFEILGKEANLNYQADITLNNMNWTATVVHIVFVERGKYDTINLYENDRRVGILSVR